MVCWISFDEPGWVNQKPNCAKLYHLCIFVSSHPKFFLCLAQTASAMTFQARTLSVFAWPLSSIIKLTTMPQSCRKWQIVYTRPLPPPPCGWIHILPPDRWLDRVAYSHLHWTFHRQNSLRQSCHQSSVPNDHLLYISLTSFYSYMCATSTYTALVQLYTRLGQLPMAEGMVQKGQGKDKSCKMRCKVIEDMHHIHIVCPEYIKLREEAEKKVAERTWACIQAFNIEETCMLNLLQKAKSLFIDCKTTWLLHYSFCYLGHTLPIDPHVHVNMFASVVNIPICFLFSLLFIVSITFLISLWLLLFKLCYLEATDIFLHFSHWKHLLSNDRNIGNLFQCIRKFPP